MAPSIRPIPVEPTEDRADIKDDGGTKPLLVVPDAGPIPTLRLNAVSEESFQISGSNVLKQLKLEHPDGVSSTGEMLKATLLILEKEATGSSYVFARMYEALLQDIENGIEERSPFNIWVSLLIREMVHGIFAQGPEDPLLQPLPEEDEKDGKVIEKGETLEKQVVYPLDGSAVEKSETLEPSPTANHLITALNEFANSLDSSRPLVLDTPPTDPFAPFNLDPAIPLSARDVPHATLQPPPPEALDDTYPSKPFNPHPSVPLTGPVKANPLLASRDSLSTILRHSSLDNALKTPFGLIVLGIMFGGTFVLYSVFRIFKCCTRPKRK
ncbi:hypothetical protein BJ875DRAFT_443420 [Amylocarpus encephaloides]|uniref:Uncharacterized protein n=1 Tax=Amylocarpus encephaloides TaxID=45428 RepID=A0A9P8C357_9HELO|nr:hypothetical protein BJ875DRAFT_443420 [Amylocarpus encephaloides]